MHAYICSRLLASSPMFMFIFFCKMACGMYQYVFCCFFCRPWARGSARPLLCTCTPFDAFLAPGPTKSRAVRVLCRVSRPRHDAPPRAANGRGYVFLDVFGELLHWGGQLLVSYVLVGLAYGWTLSSRAVQKYIPDDKVK